MSYAVNRRNKAIHALIMIRFVAFYMQALGQYSTDAEASGKFAAKKKIDEDIYAKVMQIRIL